MSRQSSCEKTCEKILEFSNDPVIVIDGSIIRFANSAFAHLVGEDAAKFECQKVGYLDYFAKEDQTALICSFAEIDAGADDFETKRLRLLTKNNGFVEVLVKLVPIQWYGLDGILLSMWPKEDDDLSEVSKAYSKSIGTENTDFFIDVLDSLSQAVTVFDPNLRLVLWNDRLQEILDLPKELLKVGTPLEALLRFNAERGEYGDVDIEETVAKMLKNALESKATEPYRYERQRPNGGYIRVFGRRTSSGFIVTTYSDCTEEKEREEYLKQLVAELEHQELEARFHHSMVEETAAKNVQLMEDISLAEDEARRQSAFLSGVLDNTGQGISVFDSNLRLVAWNRPLEQLLDFPAGFLEHGMHYEDLLDFNEKRGEEWEAPKKEILKHLQHCLKERLGELEVFDRMRPNGIIVEVSRRFMPDGSLITTHSDVTEIRKAEERAQLLALRDELTGLANRRAFDAAMEDAQSSARAADSGFVIAYIDLDNFKQVNDTYGHTIGDAVLQSVAAIMSNNVKASDLVARMGGDEFAIVFRDTLNVEMVHERVSSMVQQIGALKQIEGNNINIGASAGISAYPQHGDKSDQLIELADSSLYKAKNAGKGCVFMASA